MAMTKTKAIIMVLAIAITVAVSTYLLISIVIGGGYLPSLPPSCSGYPPGGNCHANYTYDFTITVNYSGPWVLNYYGFHNGEPSGPHSNSYYLSSGSYTGEGFYTTSVKLSGDNYYFLTLCAWAQKLDDSTSTLALTVTGSNSTSQPRGSTYYCGGVAP